MGSQQTRALHAPCVSPREQLLHFTAFLECKAAIERGRIWVCYRGPTIWCLKFPYLLIRLFFPQTG